MTIRGLFRELVIATLRQQDAHERDLVLAWHIEALHRQKKLPALKTLLQKRQARPQTNKQHRTMLQLLAARYGGAVRPLSDAARKALIH